MKNRYTGVEVVRVAAKPGEKGYVGCSSLAGLESRRGFHTPLDVWKVYTGRKEAPGEELQKLFNAGHIMEDAIMRLSIENCPEWGIAKVTAPKKAYACADLPKLICHPDRLVVGKIDGKDIAVEIKFSHSKDWGEEDSDKVPVDYIWQAQGYFACGVPCDEVWIIRWGGWGQPRRHIITPDERMITAIRQDVAKALKDWDEGKKPDPSTAEEAAEAWPTVDPDASLVASDSLLQEVMDYGRYASEKKELEAKMEKISTDVTLAMQGRKYLYGDGDLAKKPVVTMVQRKNSVRLDGRRLKAEMPEVYDKYAVVPEQEYGAPYPKFN